MSRVRFDKDEASPKQHRGAERLAATEDHDGRDKQGAKERVGLPKGELVSEEFRHENERDEDEEGARQPAIGQTPDRAEHEPEQPDHRGDEPRQLGSRLAERGYGAPWRRRERRQVS